ncbi:hypothetical protein DSM21852_41680 [Methylocystis bryophila]|uniref:Uncharacterized protein n=1 Tax=Methylocystis bryophila TaxID=655015 RepID=A0A1W6MTA4_9HYPH|nr:hypothetical protein B1812_06780 [Methylocystis bryophila]BDV40915.1 hypothetical protein DSM21852_41680 [Methylocystis bryophila]
MILAKPRAPSFVHPGKQKAGVACSMQGRPARGLRRSERIFASEARDSRGLAEATTWRGKNHESLAGSADPTSALKSEHFEGARADCTEIDWPGRAKFASAF